MSLMLTAIDGWPWPAFVLVILVLSPFIRRFIREARTLPARALVPGLLRRASRFVGPFDLTGDAFFAADGAGAAIVTRRREALDQLSSRLTDQFADSAGWGRSLRDSLSDLRFTDLSRVPFPFAR